MTTPYRKRSSTQRAKWRTARVCASEFWTARTAQSSERGKRTDTRRSSSPSPVFDLVDSGVMVGQGHAEILQQVKGVKEMASITVDGVEYVPAVDATPSEVQIVVAQRGWVFVGKVSTTEEDLVITDAKNIRIWGTSKGLGELSDGPISDTKYDEYGTVTLPKLSVVARINASKGAWV